MGQVRKDILNGWKEIGGYVGRDIRTVERWEKLRGLPVRRLPGAGRATVYALTSELDEWLENSHPDAPAPATGGPVASLPSGPGILSNSQPAAARAAGASAVDPISTIPAAQSRPKLVMIRPFSPASEPHPASAGGPRAWFTPGRRKPLAVLTVSAAAALLCVFASPAVRSHPVPAAASSKYSSDPAETISRVPYSSRVSGVDELYLQGIYSYEQRTPESLGRSRDDFSGAIAKDPGYAPAYAALANTYNLMREYSVMPDAEAYPKALAAAQHAVALDPKLPEAHASLGFIDFFWSWDTVNAEREFRTALALDPSSVIAHHWYGSMLTHEGRYTEAIEQLDLAQRLEPTSAAILSTRALALGLSGHRGEAVDLLQDLISESPGVSAPHAILSTLSKVEPQDSARFLFEMRRTAELRHSAEMLQVAAAAEPALRSGGESAMWAAILTTEEHLHPGASNRTFLMVEAETALGRNEGAFADLKVLLQRRDPALIGVILDPTLSPLRRDPRFGQLIASMGLPPLQQ